MEFTKDKPWVSDEVKGNKVECHEEKGGVLAVCRWKNKDFQGKFHDVFILSSEKQPDNTFKEKIEFTDIGKNLIRGTELESKLKPGSNILELS